MNNELQKIFASFTVGGQTIPVSFMRYTGKATTYITYQEIQDDTSFSADDELQAYVKYYDFDIYSKGNYLTIVESVKEEISYMRNVRISDVESAQQNIVQLIRSMMK